MVDKRVLINSPPVKLWTPYHTADEEVVSQQNVYITVLLCYQVLGLTASHSDSQDDGEHGSPYSEGIPGLDRVRDVPHATDPVLLKLPLAFSARQ